MTGNQATTQTTQLYNSNLDEAAQRDALTGGAVPIAVYGLGKMGLPLAAVLADITGNVVGADVDPAVAKAVDSGETPVQGEPGLEQLVADRVDAGALRATTDIKHAARDASIHVVLVPTLLDEDDRPDLSVVESALTDVAAGLDPGDLVIVESTLPPRSCVDRLGPLLIQESGLSRGEFGLAFCPERTKSGRALEDIRGAYPKVVGGIDEESSRAAKLLYDQVTDNEVVVTSDATTAEAVKVFEGVYRDVNIALANELAKHAEEFEIDVVEAIEVANTQPFCDIHTPGAGVGGHCIPYYPRFISELFDAPSELIETARNVNDSMPQYTARNALDGLRDVGVAPDNASALVLGLTYAPGIDELRATPALPVVEHLADAGVDVTVTDPITDDTDQFEAAGADVASLSAVEEQTYDAVVLVTDQPAFEALDVLSLGGDGPLVVVDGRQALTDLRGHDAVHYRGVGLHE